MSGMSDPHSAGQLSDDAIEWLVLLHSGRAGHAERQAFEQWRRQSVMHEAAALEAEALWDEVGQTAAARRFVPEDVSGRGASRRGRRALSRRALLAGGVGASACCLAVLSSALGPLAAPFADYRTRRGERRHIALPDGSTAWLATESALSIDFSGRERRLVLHAGEALFEVKRDAERPFIVSAGGGEAQALGTVYAVRHDSHLVRVDVAQGIVAVRPGPGLAASRLTAGQCRAYADGRFLSGVEQINANAVAAWHRGKLIFNRQPLGEVIQALQRHRYGRIVIADERLEVMPVTGVFDLDDDDATFAMLQQTLPVSVTRLPLLTILRSTPAI